MRHPIVLLLLVLLPCAAAAAQESQSVTPSALQPAAQPAAQSAAQPALQSATQSIEQVEISGISEERLSESLRLELEALKGRPYDSATANQLADRIQSELPEHVAASRVMPGTQPDRIRLVFAVAKITDKDPLGMNINARYTVESAEIAGAQKSLPSAPLAAEIRRMVGQQLDNAEADRLQARLALELKPKYGVSKRVIRGTTPQEVKVIYDVYRIPWLSFREPESFVSYHPKLNGSFSLNTALFGGGFGSGPHLGATVNVPDIPPGSSGPAAAPKTPFTNDGPRPGSVKELAVGVANSGDDLLERYKGFRVALETIHAGTERIGLRLEYSVYGVRWKPQTLWATEGLAAADLYRRRQTLEPSVAFAVTPGLFVTAGVRVADLAMQYPAEGSLAANAAVGSIRYRRAFKSGSATHTVAAGYDVTAAARSLDSDFVYTRHFWNADYLLGHERNTLRVTALAGAIIGNAPLFDRFSIGNTQTLRGWNKFDLAPRGGSRLAHGSLEYGQRWGSDTWRIFYDVGSVWDEGGPIAVRNSFGFSLGSFESKGGFVTLAFQVRGAHLSPMITLRLP